jgi:predicted dehydrogenase
LIIGVGSIGERHLRCFGQTNRAELSICETNEALRQKVAARYSIPTAFGTLEEALADPSDAAVICTPAHLHLPMAHRLAETGVHLLIEKPLSTSLDGVERLRTMAESKKLVTAVAYVNRMHPLLGAARDAILSGRYGKPVELVAVAGQHFPFYRPAYRDIYYNDRATGGGAIQDALTHMINTGEWLVGPVSECAADAAHQVLSGVDVEDTVHVIARHGSVQASYSLNQHQAANEATINLVCERGVVKIEQHLMRWRWATKPDESWHDETFPPLERDDLFVSQANMFLDAVEHGSPAACSLDEGEQTLRVNLAILKAADTRTWQTIA